MPVSFLGLPTEIHLLIIDQLVFRDKIHLKRSCAYFYDLVPPLSHGELLEAETTDYARERDLYACRFCLRLLPASEFADRMLRRRRGKYGRNADRRFCVACGLKPRDAASRYGPGAHITMENTFYVICISCKTFQRGAFDRHGRHTSECERCWQRGEASRQKPTTRCDRIRDTHDG